MRSFIALRRLSLVTLFVLSAVPVTRAFASEDGSNDMGPLAFTVSVPSGRVSLKQVHQAVVRAAIHREWNIKEDHTNKVVIHLLHRRHDATVTFLITDQQVKAYCVGYKMDRHGEPEKPEQPRSWLNYLKKDITKALETDAYLKN